MDQNFKLNLNSSIDNLNNSNHEVMRFLEKQNPVIPDKLNKDYILNNHRGDLINNVVKIDINKSLIAKEFIKKDSYVKNSKIPENLKDQIINIKENNIIYIKDESNFSSEIITEKLKNGSNNKNKQTNNNSIYKSTSNNYKVEKVLKRPKIKIKKKPSDSNINKTVNKDLISFNNYTNPVNNSKNNAKDSPNLIFNNKYKDNNYSEENKLANFSEDELNFKLENKEINEAKNIENINLTNSNDLALALANYTNNNLKINDYSDLSISHFNNNYINDDENYQNKNNNNINFVAATEMQNFNSSNNFLIDNKNNQNKIKKNDYNISDKEPNNAKKIRIIKEIESNINYKNIINNNDNLNFEQQKAKNLIGNNTNINFQNNFNFNTTTNRNLNNKKNNKYFSDNSIISPNLAPSNNINNTNVNQNNINNNNKKCLSAKLKENRSFNEFENLNFYQQQAIKSKYIKNKNLQMLNANKENGVEATESPDKKRDSAAAAESQSKKTLYEKFSEILSVKYSQNEGCRFGGSLIKLFLLDLICILLCIGFYSCIYYIGELGRRPVMCDIAAKWPAGLYYGLRPKTDLGDLTDCASLCNAKGEFWTSSNNFLFAKVVLISVFLLRLNATVCLLHGICKRFKFCLFFVFVLIQIITVFILFYFSLVRSINSLINYNHIFYFLLAFMESKSSFYLSVLFSVCCAVMMSAMIFTNRIYVFFLEQTLAGGILFPIYQYFVTVIFNFLLSFKLMRFMPVALKYFLLIMLNSCFEGFKAGIYFVTTENGFANFHFMIFIFFDVLMHFAKKYKLFERCLTSLFSICNDKLKSKIKENDKLNDTANIETQLYALAGLVFLIYRKFSFFPAQSFKFVDCMGNPNPEYFNPNKNADILVALLAGKIVLLFVFSNVIFPKCYKTSPYLVPSFKGFMENFSKISVCLHAAININSVGINFGMFYYKNYFIEYKQDNF